MYLYLTASVKQRERGIGDFWGHPTESLAGFIDLRSLAELGQMTTAVPKTLYALDAQDRNLDGYLGEVTDWAVDAPSSTQKGALEQRLGLARGTLNATTYRDIVAELLLLHGDPLATDRWGLLRGAPARGVRIHLGQEIYRARFEKSHPAFANTIAVYRAHYTRYRDAGVPLDVLQRFTGARRLRLGMRSDEVADALLPEKYRDDGYREPTTTIGDTFTDTNGVELTSHTPTGPNAWDNSPSADYTLVVGSAADATIQSNALQIENSSTGVIARAEVDFSDDAHHSQAARTSDDSNARNAEILTRMAASAQTAYRYINRRASTNTHRLFTWITGSLAQIGSTVNEAGLTMPYTVKLESNASDEHQMSRDGNAQGSAITNTSIQDNLRAGVGGSNVIDVAEQVTLDDFEAADPAAGAASVLLFVSNKHGGRRA